MSEINNEEIRSILFKISKEIILPKYQKLKTSDIKSKQGGDLVTSVDVDVENGLKKNLFRPKKISYSRTLAPVPL